MDADVALGALILDLYDAAYDTGRWPAVLERLSAHVGAQGTHFFLWDKRGDTLLVSGLSGFRPEAETLYGSHYGAIDPRRRLLENQPIGGLFACHTRFDDTYVRQSEFYNDFLIPMGARYVLISRLADDSDVTRVVGFLRSPQQAPFDDEAQRRVAPLMPHLVRAALFTSRFAELRRAERRLDASLDHVGWGILLVDAAGRVAFANAAAEALLRVEDGLRIEHGRLAAARPDDTARLGQLIRCSVEDGGRSAGGAMPLARPSGRRPLQLLVGPLSEPPPRLGIRQARHAIVIATDPDRAGAPTAERLQALFDLTPAEARVAAELADGQSIDVIAARHRTSRNTVRVQVQKVLEKTGTRRQAELVGLLARVPRLEPNAVGPDRSDR